MTTWRKFSRSLTRLTDRLALPSGFSADGRSLGLGLAAALENQRRAARPSDEEIARFLRGSAPDEGLIKA
ncbi:hypothetical protein AB0M02_17515 [Actinoplanes sp. NPDC051861]|uniref:hypothetical protein n=1 Tax=Actinoplanes sp. NPDC051861 TaxID=3155170 RepID=UPI0034460A8B